MKPGDTLFSLIDHEERGFKIMRGDFVELVGLCGDRLHVKHQRLNILFSLPRSMFVPFTLDPEKSRLLEAETSLFMMTKNFNDFVKACTDEHGLPREPTVEALKIARSQLPTDCELYLKVDL